MNQPDKSLSQLRSEARVSARRAIRRADVELYVKFTPAAKRFLLCAIASAFSGRANDTKRIGVVKDTGRPMKGRVRNYGRRSRNVRPNSDVSVLASRAIEDVATYIKETHGILSPAKVIDVEDAIRAKWCKIFPICNELTARKLELQIRGQG